MLRLLNPTTHRKPRPMKPVEALRALRELLKNPDDTSQVFRMIKAMEGPALDRMFDRFVHSATGRRILVEKRDLLKTLIDEEYLESLPEGSLGRVYLDFRRKAGITADGLVEASEVEDRMDDEDLQRFRDRMRDSHDLWHVVTGYDTDLVGEGAVLAFSFAQGRNPAIGMIVAAGFLRARGPMAYARPIIVEGFRRGLTSAWLPVADWEALLERPLDEVRAEFGLTDTPTYEHLWSKDLPEGGLLAA